MQVGVIYGNPEITSGGNALKFYASVRLEVRRKATIKGATGDDDIGIRVKAKVRGRAYALHRSMSRYRAGTCTGEVWAGLGRQLMCDLLCSQRQCSGMSLCTTAVPALTGLAGLQIVKNKCAAPYKLAEFDILFGSGISSEGCTLDAAEAVGVVSRKGSWYRCGVALSFTWPWLPAGSLGPGVVPNSGRLLRSSASPLDVAELAVCCSYGERRLAQGREKTLAMVQEDKELLKCARLTHHATCTALLCHDMCAYWWVRWQCGC